MSSTRATTGSTSESAIPLGWTQVKRRRRDAGDEPCCPDNCNRVTPTPFLESSQALVGRTILEGHAVFCLHTIDPSWMQGYFVPNGSRKPLGMLAVQEDVDDCLACQDGGFRRLSISLFQVGKEPLQYQQVDWTGGDMMRLSHKSLQMEADRMLAGSSALPLIQQYFQGLTSKLRAQCQVDKDISILEFLPDVAVVVGKMTWVLDPLDENET